MHASFNAEQSFGLLARPISLANAIALLLVRCTKSMSKREDIRMLIDPLGKLTLLALEQFAVVPGLEGLLDADMQAKLKEITLRRYDDDM